MSEKTGDVVYTPEWCAEDMVKHFSPSGRVLEPCRGQGVFMRFLPDDAEWCEISEGRDFFDWSEPVDWVISNPPYSLTRRWFRHSYSVADNLVYLVPLRNVFSGYGFLREIEGFGGIKEIRVYGTGGRLGFPMGNAVGAFHVARGWRGDTRISYFDDDAPSNDALFADYIDAPTEPEEKWGWAEDVFADHLSDSNVHVTESQQAARDAVAIDPTGRILLRFAGSRWQEVATGPARTDPEGEQE